MRAVSERDGENNLLLSQAENAAIKKQYSHVVVYKQA
jgi:hypothetical protein